MLYCARTTHRLECWRISAHAARGRGLGQGHMLYDTPTACELHVVHAGVKYWRVLHVVMALVAGMFLAVVVEFKIQLHPITPSLPVLDVTYPLHCAPEVRALTHTHTHTHRETPVSLCKRKPQLGPNATLVPASLCMQHLCVYVCVCVCVCARTTQLLQLHAELLGSAHPCIEAAVAFHYIPSQTTTMQPDAAASQPSTQSNTRSDAATTPPSAAGTAQASEAPASNNSINSHIHTCYAGWVPVVSLSLTVFMTPSEESDKESEAAKSVRAAFDKV